MPALHQREFLATSWTESRRVRCPVPVSGKGTLRPRHPFTLSPLPLFDRIESPNTVRSSQPLHLVGTVLRGHHIEQLPHYSAILRVPLDPIEEHTLPLPTGSVFAFPHPPLRLFELTLLVHGGRLIAASDGVKGSAPRPSALPRRLLLERLDGHGYRRVSGVREIKRVDLVAVRVVHAKATAPVPAEGVDCVLCGVVGPVHCCLEGVALPTPHLLRDEFHLGRVACRADNFVCVPQLGPGDAGQDTTCAYIREREKICFVVLVDGDEGVAGLSDHDRRAGQGGLLGRVCFGVDAVFVGRYVACRRGRVVRHLFGDYSDCGRLGVLLGRQVVVGEFTQEEFAEEWVEWFLESFFDGAAYIVLPLEGGEV